MTGQGTGGVPRKSTARRKDDLAEAADTGAGKHLAGLLSEFARTMVTDFPIQAILDSLVGRIVEIMPVTGAGVTLIAPGMDPRYIAASDSAALRFEQLQTELGEGPCLAAYDTGEAVAVPDLREDDQFPTFSRQAGGAGLRAAFTFPLRHNDLRLGALDLYRDTPGHLSGDWMDAAQTLADVAAAYLLNAQARTDLQDASDQSREAALHDALTGLPNRVLMSERLQRASAREHRSSRTFALLYIDLNRFKNVNDTYGHQAGDELLVAVAERLSSGLREVDTLSRLSGDEFVILCEDLEDRAQAETIVARVDAAFAQPFVLPANEEIHITASIGVAFSAAGGAAPEALLREADLAMYREKHTSGGMQVLHDGILNVAEEQAVLADALPGAIERGEMHLEYQPIVAAYDGRVTGVEALVRWTRPGRGPVAPNVLIPLAEQSGQIVELGRWVLQQAWSDRHAWETQHAREFNVSINVSAHQLMSPGFVGGVKSIVSRTNSPRLTLEVTESVFMRDGKRALIVLNDLKEMGLTLALDDFGTGYSSLSHVMNYPVDTIKLDQSFVANLERVPASITVIDAVIHLAHGLDMKITSEGIETAHQHQQLAELGCDSCQGYYFARPMSAFSIDALLTSHDDADALCLPELSR